MFNTEMESVLSNEPVRIVSPPGTTYLTRGWAAYVYVTDDSKYIIKQARGIRGRDPNWVLFRDMVKNEADVYERLGSHDGLLAYHGYDAETGSVTLDHASDGDLTDFINGNPQPGVETRVKFARQLADILLYIHSCNVTTQDVKTDNVLIHHGALKICDFTEAIMYPTDGGKQLHELCDKQELDADLLGMGCVLYSIATWQVFNYDLWEDAVNGRRVWPTLDALKPTDDVMFGSVIDKCWYRAYESTEEFHADLLKSIEAIRAE